MADLQVYPFATKRGDSIPLDVIRPNGTYYDAVTGAASALVSLPSTARLAVLYATAPCIVSFGALAPALVAGVFLTKCLFLPANCLYVVAFPDMGATPGFSTRATTVTTGHIFLTLIEKWAELALDTNLVKK